MSTLAPPLTVEDYRILDETEPRYQLIEGALHLAPASNRYHQSHPHDRMRSGLPLVIATTNQDRHGLGSEGRDGNPGTPSHGRPHTRFVIGRQARFPPPASAY